MDKEYTEKMKENCEEMLAEALRNAKENKPVINISKKLMEGISALKILEGDEKGNHDIIIIGSRGLGSVKRFLLGYVSNNVVNQAEIPVFILK